MGRTEFQLSMLAPYDSTGERFWLAKSRSMIEWYEQVIRSLRPERILEVGMLHGGSLAFFAELTRARIVGIDIDPPPNSALEHFVRDSHADVHAYWETDQSDAEVVGAILDAEYSEPLDLVIDDASHLLEPSMVTFNLAFPRLRRGGVYVLEDWGWAHRWSEMKGDVGDLPSQLPLTRLVVEATMTCASRSDIIESVTIARDTVSIVRGPAELEDFELSTAYDPGFLPVI